MLNHRPLSWFYPRPTGDLGRDRNARTIQFACLLFQIAVVLVAVLDIIGGEKIPPTLWIAVSGLAVAAFMNRAGRAGWAARTGVLAVLLTAILLVFQARDGFRSHAMLVFPGLLLISVMLLDRAHYLTTAVIVLLAVAALGIAERRGLTRAIPRVRTPTSYDSIFFVDLTLFVFAAIGSRIARDAESNISDLRVSIRGLSSANRDLSDTAEALRASQLKQHAQAAEQRAIMDAAPVAIFIAHDAECRHITGNRAAYALVRESPGGNLSKSAPAGERLSKYRMMRDGVEIPPDDLPMQRAARTGQPIRDCSFQTVFEDASGIELVANAEPLLDDQGRPCGAVAVISDVTDRKRFEEALRDSEVKFRATFMNSADALLIVALDDGTIVDVNDAFEALYGYTREEAVGKTTLQLHLYVHPEDRERALAEVRAKRRLKDFEVVARKKSGDQFTGSLSTKMFMLHGRCHLAAAVRDITERKQAEQMLRQRTEHLRALFNHQLIGITITSAAKDWVEVNARWCEMIGYSKEELTSIDWPALTHSEDLAADLAQFQRLCAGEIDHYSLQKRFIRKDGTILYAEISVSCVRRLDGSIDYIIGLATDLTERMRSLEEAFVRQKLESLGTLASGIAHDFNNLLGAILAQSEMAMAEAAGGTYPHHELKQIREVAIRGSEIVRQLMIYAGKDSDVLELIDLSKAVEEMLEFLKLSISKHAVLVPELSGNLPQVSARAAQIRQIVMNLIVNASDALQDRDGVIRVTTASITVGRDTPALPAEGLAAGAYLQLEVSDTGCGMSQETKARMFDPFFTTKSAGRGLGLAVIHGIVRSLNGAVRVVSEPGKGSTFQILLPCAKSAAGSHPDPAPETDLAVSPALNATVLVVEDEAPLRQAVVKMLRKAAFEVKEAADGCSAIDQLHAYGRKIDIVLLDMTIPGTSSHDVVMEAAKVRPDIKVLMTSAYSEDMVAAEMDMSKIHGFIRKPFRLIQLVERLRTTLVR